MSSRYALLLKDEWSLSCLSESVVIHIHRGLARLRISLHSNDGFTAAPSYASQTFALPD